MGTGWINRAPWFLHESADDDDDGPADEGNADGVARTESTTVS